MSRPYVLHGWHLSYFTGKTRAYLRYKNVPFVDHAVDAVTLMRRSRSAPLVNSVTMPFYSTRRAPEAQASTSLSRKACCRAMSGLVCGS